ncbi:MAG: S-adenosylmethionine decarboxylase [Gammaproteobacteria bacterium]|nr:S-adenosylmethionine decarboxylase [Gammaproteobacteria bacterium]
MSAPLLCPEILRQRLIIEGLYRIPPPDPAFIRAFLLDLGAALGMHPLCDVLVFSPDEVSELHHGIAGFLPWAESGCSLYTWSERRFFVVEVFSCKAFDADACRDYAAGRFATDTIEMRLV